MVIQSESINGQRSRVVLINNKLPHGFCKRVYIFIAFKLWGRMVYWFHYPGRQVQYSQW